MLLPTTAYKRLNELLWMNRLPPATIIMVDESVLPCCYGLTIQDEVVALPVILLNSGEKRWGLTLVHECLHVAEPALRHGKVFETLVQRYWKIARENVKGLK